MGGFRDLIVWQKADELAREIYLTTEEFPQKEMFGLTSQIRRAALSVPTNIAEGNSRRSKKDQIHFLDIAKGSLAETDYLLGFSRSLGFIETDTSNIESLILQTGKLLARLRSSLTV